MKKYLAQKEQKLRDFTDETYAQGSYAFSRLLREREIKVNGRKVSANVLLHPGDEVQYFTTPREEARVFYTVLYRDENILVVDKFDGVNSEALFSALQEKYGVSFIHRLDRNTRGVQVFACSEEAERQLKEAFRFRRAVKIYEAICFNPFSASEASETAYLKKDEKKSLVSIQKAPFEGAEKILTQYKVLRSYGEYSLVEIRLHSGKTHQIRAHMAFLGHPVAGDEKYGDEAKNKKYAVKRQILVAKKLSFKLSGELAYLSDKEFVSAFSAAMETADDGKTERGGRG